ncbi:MULTISPECIES: DUF2513 domain-containing protein [Legionella]|uniref:DUF2513 domain-containing protein n=1 Tax=Legionella pneumophila subsp. pascullei TaxID=91890 RepID=A0AAX2IXJ5_LEGPN|nr:MULTISPECIES: DUF2513 domain-containing protein [Legionella]HAT6917737.1 DUF2513 domain-containing protein [Legionella pneumophila]AMP89084.1 hypothetical protein AXF35_05040 [Legionella pneumophila subsp. pascullei]AMP93249.1 hypothetical protein AXF36_11755 [Legionella pneumophila subsp. pascullei]AMP96215.1 hypothetical protein AXF37_11645 [Legionella pneumophila subsp. pascullei]MBN9226124.1 DUF2513 domain-containing protein [Legionella steelei]
MRRDWDVIRNILIKIENLETNTYLQLKNFPESEHNKISHHIELLCDDNLIECNIHKTTAGRPYDFHVSRLTWRGHEFLDSVRSDTVWSKTKEVFKNKGVDMGFNLIIATAQKIAGTLLS